jgi:metal-responsive CopG/Arc/MetJ family transcriptional regulator
MNDTQVAIRFPDDLLQRLDHWRDKQPIQPSRSEAIRYFVSLTLSGYEEQSNVSEMPTG